MDPTRADALAVGPFNVHNLEFIKSVVETAEEEKSPVIMAVGVGSISYMGLETLAKAALLAAERASVPEAVHLDHARDVALVKAALECGLSSVMFDGSGHDFAANAKDTIDVVEMAHARGATAEGEAGMTGITDSVRHKMKLFGSAGKA